MPISRLGRMCLRSQSCSDGVRASPRPHALDQQVSRQQALVADGHLVDVHEDLGIRRPLDTLDDRHRRVANEVQARTSPRQWLTMDLYRLPDYPA